MLQLVEQMDLVMSGSTTCGPGHRKLAASGSCWPLMLTDWISHASCYLILPVDRDRTTLGLEDPLAFLVVKITTLCKLIHCLDACLLCSPKQVLKAELILGYTNAKL